MLLSDTTVNFKSLMTDQIYLQRIIQELYKLIVSEDKAIYGKKYITDAQIILPTISNESTQQLRNTVGNFIYAYVNYICKEINHSDKA